VTAASYSCVFGLLCRDAGENGYLMFRAPDVLRKISGLWRTLDVGGLQGASRPSSGSWRSTDCAASAHVAWSKVCSPGRWAYDSFKQPLSAGPFRIVDLARRGAIGRPSQLSAHGLKPGRHRALAWHGLLDSIGAVQNFTSDG